MPDHLFDKMPNEKPANLRDIQREQTRQRLFDASIEEFCRVGVDKARVDQICKTVGVAKGTFFFHFPTKDHILLARQQQISESMAARIDSELNRVATAKSFLKRLVDIIFEEHEAVGNIELVQQINLAIVRQSGSQSLNISKTAFGAALVKQIERLQKDQKINSNIHAAELADCLRLSLFGFLVNPQVSFDQLRPKVDLLTGLLAESLG